MATYIITYDLITMAYQDRSDDYVKVREKIKEFGTWAKITESCYAVKSDLKTTEVRDIIMSLLNDNDRIFVVKSANIAAWRNAICRSEWLKEHI